MQTRRRFYTATRWLQLEMIRILTISLTFAICAFSPAVLHGMEYGATGPYSVLVDQIENATILYPKEAIEPVPVIFFVPGYGTASWTGYGSLLRHIASQGVAAVYSDYLEGQDRVERYDLIWKGFLSAVDRYIGRFDLSRVGFCGHSYGAFIYIMAPYEALEVTDKQLASIPYHTNLIVQSFNQDTVAIPSIATELFATLTSAIPLERYAFYYTDGEHSEPSDRTVNETDVLSIRMPLDALMDYSFQLDQPEAGQQFALEPGEDHYLTTVLKDPGVDWDDPINQQPEEPTLPPEDDDNTDFTRLFQFWLNLLKDR